MSSIAKQSIFFGVLMFILQPFIQIPEWSELTTSDLMQSFAVAVVAGLLFFLVLKRRYRKEQQSNTSGSSS